MGQSEGTAVSPTMEGSGGKSLDGLREQCFQWDGYRTCSQVGRMDLSNKLRNKLKKSYNLNEVLRQNVLVIHWNIGSKLWLRRRLR